MQSPVIRAIFRTRELVLASEPDTAVHPRGVVAFTKSLGWNVLMEAPNESIFRHETRVQTTDAIARVKFRRYWALFSPGIKLIRWLILEPLRRDAEHRAGAHVGGGH